jgi:hypothetical protein
MKRAIIFCFLVMSGLLLSSQNPVGFTVAGFYEFSKGSINDLYGDSYGPLIGLKLRGIQGFLRSLSIEGYYGFASDDYTQVLNLPGDQTKEFTLNLKKNFFDLNLGYSMKFKKGSLRLLIGGVNLRTKEKFGYEKTLTEKWGLSVGGEYVFEFGSEGNKGLILGARYHHFGELEVDLSNLKVYLGLSVYISPFKNKYL